MMLGILRRKVASRGCSSSLIIRQSLPRIESTRASDPLCHSTKLEETLISGRRSRIAKNVGLHIYRDVGLASKPLRDAVAVHQMDSLFRFGSRSFSSDSGDLVDAVVPFMGESISDGTLATFLKSMFSYIIASVEFVFGGVMSILLILTLSKFLGLILSYCGVEPGDRVEVDEPIAQVETDKVTIDVASPEAGVIQKFVANEGDTVEPGTKIAIISKSSEGVTAAVPSEKMSSKPAASEPPPKQDKVEKETPKPESSPPKEKPKPSSPQSSKPSATEPVLPPKERERRVPMTRLRKRVATRLKDSQNTFALLTTFNEVDMTNLMKLRSDYKDAFLEKHGVKLGLMSGFVKAAVSALQNQPIINAVIDGEDIIYRDYIDISIAVGTPKGLVVPVIRNADKMNFADIEKEINMLARKANDGTISIDEMAGGSFTISNGGVYGSLISTPIINPPQSAILGMHSIVNRPMVVGGNIVSRPMMYIALTYDHRLIDGREAVFFLRRIKDVVEDPRRLLLDI
ncbi:2-oxoacid dehydrogenase acyltransferase, catalytic domain [Dillenia turbinata]|uniref:dihydrolipoyllysine-residue succinyltransferase n=1 Tax=Dillenia turbinata TaxID=194707 RepID=A0AAN8VFW6_9MAGN